MKNTKFVLSLLVAAVVVAGCSKEAPKPAAKQDAAPPRVRK